MGLPKGKTNNPKGRKRGVGNKSTETLRTLLHEFIEQNIEDLQICYNSLDAKEKLLFLERLLRHVLPQPLSELERLSNEDLDNLISRLREQNNNLRLVK